MKKLSLIFSLLIISALILAGCAQATEAPEDEVEEMASITIGYGAPELSGGQGQIMDSLVSFAQEKDWAEIGRAHV